MPKELQKKLDEAGEKVTALEADLAKANETIETLKAKTDDGACGSCGHVEVTEDVVIDKSKLDPVVLKKMEEQDEQLKSQAKSIEKMEEANLTTVMISKAAEVPNIGAITDVSSLLKSVSKLSADVGEKVFDMLKSANARIAAGDLLKENNNGDPSKDGNTAVEKIEAAAKDLQKTAPNLSDQQAFAQIFKSNAELRQQYIDEEKQQD